MAQNAQNKKPKPKKKTATKTGSTLPGVKSTRAKKVTSNQPAAPKPWPRRFVLAVKVRISTVVPEDAKTFLRTPRAAQMFTGGCLAILLLTTIFWSLLSARLQQANADQLIDTYLFEDLRTFQGATFPGAHTMLLKWPVFALMQLFGATTAVFITATVGMVLATVGFLVYLLHRIERRPLVFGLLCLALSSVLLLVPAQPSAGALLPVNMAMTTTRNLEYIVYIAALCLLVRVRSVRSRQFAAAVILLLLLIASDKLFIVLAAGAGLSAGARQLLLIRKTVRQKAHELRYAVYLLAAAAAAAVLAICLLLVVNKLGWTHINGGQGASPYMLNYSPKRLLIALVYAAMALFTNFGANPIHGVVIIRDLPAALLRSLWHPSAPVYLLNLVISVSGLYAAATLWKRRSDDNKARYVPDAWIRLSMFLIGSTAAAVAVYVLTDHYYPVDARYMTVSLFAVFIAAAVYVRTRPVKPACIAAAAAVLLAVLPLGILTSWDEYRSSESAMAGRNKVAQRVSNELDRRKVGRLIGNYWDITPAKAAAARPLTISPVDTCDLPRQVLSSSAWFGRPAKISTAYLAVKDGSPLAGPDGTKSSDSITYNGCSLAHVVGMYGVPSERVAIKQQSGTNAEDTPDILLLLYPGGVKQQQNNQSGKTTQAGAAETAEQPAERQSLVPFTEREVCSSGTTLQVVAHEDDDLLFMNPDVYASIREGRCIRTVYVTAGDSGENISYWGNREQGAKAAYAQMYGVADNWRDEQQMLAGHQVTVSYLADVPDVSLVFMRLPDGNFRGEGFTTYKNESLHSLMAGTVSNIRTVDSAAVYGKQQLIDALLELMVKDLPDTIRSQGSDDSYDGDHADHFDVGTITQAAAKNYLQPHNLVRYMGYPDKALPANLSDDDITRKQATFLTYAKFDGAVCQTAYECQNTYTYGSYLTRQYQLQPAAAP